MKGKQQGIACLTCNSHTAVKIGKRNNKFASIQRYKCISCRKTFSNSGQNHLKNKSYPARIILDAVSHYDLGYTQSGVAKFISRKHSITVPQKTISNWLSEYKHICTFSRLRKQACELYTPKSIIHTQTLHHIQPYSFKFHKAKLYLLFHNKLYNNQFYNTSLFYEPLKAYLEKIPTEKFPHHIFTYSKSTNDSASSPNAEIANNNNFNNENKISNIGTGQNNNEQRASQIKFSHLKIETKSKNNMK